jgi:fructokinase
MARIGIDLGGTKTEIVVLDEVQGTELYRTRVATERSYDGVVRGIRDLVALAERAVATRGTVGVGIPGSISQETGLVKNANSTWINGKPLHLDLSTALGREVRLENDANCFAMSEARDGAGAGAAVVFGVILGTGVGAGIVVNGKCLKGTNGIAGEWGHNPLLRSDSSGRLCYCGRTGCVETWLSGPGIEADHFETTGERKSAEEIATLAIPMAKYVDLLAQGLATVINILDPDVIILGGGMGKIRSLFETVPRQWAKYVFSDTVRTQLTPPVHGDSS